MPKTPKIPKAVIAELKKSPATQLDIFNLKNDIQSLLEGQSSISKNLHSIMTREVPPSYCPAENVQALITELQENKYVMARNGSLEKSKRLMSEVVAETHEAIYWMKPFGKLCSHLYIFIRTHKALTGFVGFLLVLFYNELAIALGIPISWMDTIKRFILQILMRSF